MYSSRICAFVLCLFLQLQEATADIPVNCTYDDIKGTWLFYESARNQDSDIDCSTMGDPIHKKKVHLYYPNLSIDEFGNRGTWTMVYDQGFEVSVTGRSYFAFSYYIEHNDDTIESVCGKTQIGWSRDVTIRNWSCFKGVKIEKTESKFEQEKKLHKANLDTLYKNDYEFIEGINRVQSRWRATPYHEYELMSLRDMYRRAGGQRFRWRVPTSKPSVLTRIRAKLLPEEFDWRNISGVNYVSPVRNQGTCGSCYAFASMAGLESRIRIMTLNSQQPVFSPQDVLECSILSQGCNGGFAYLIAGRYAQDKGIVLEECNPYNPAKSECKRNISCVRHYTAHYRYVGGYFGGSNEAEMKIALLKGGPLMVGLEVYKDLIHYKSGIYRHVEEVEHLGHRFNPLEETNHAVLLVGYGVDSETGELFWSVKNSWGEQWGENGYFRIRRGTDECAIESMAFEVVPIPS